MNVSGNLVGDLVGCCSVVLLFVLCDNVFLVEGLFIKVVGYDYFNGCFIDYCVKVFVLLRKIDMMGDYWFYFDSVVGKQVNCIVSGCGVIGYMFNDVFVSGSNVVNGEIEWFKFYIDVNYFIIWLQYVDGLFKCNVGIGVFDYQIEVVFVVNFLVVCDDIFCGVVNKCCCVEFFGYREMDRNIFIQVNYYDIYCFYNVGYLD